MNEAPRRTDELQGEIVHVYDGIEEADNQMPTWWVTVFLGTVAFGIAYWFGFEVYAARPSPAQEYAIEQAALATAQAAERANATAVTDELLISMAGDPATVGRGSVTFKQTCAPCHGEQAEGKIGPNLTDTYWLHGGSPVAIHNTIDHGVLEKGMPAWGAVLGTKGVRDVAAFVLTRRNARVPGKEPQGEPYAAP